LLCKSRYTRICECRLCLLRSIEIRYAGLLTKHLYLWLSCLCKAWSNKLSCWLLRILKLGCSRCSGFKLLLRSCPLCVLYWLGKCGRRNRFECILGRLLKCIELRLLKCIELRSSLLCRGECLLLRLSKRIECCLRFTKIYSLRCRGCGPVKSSRLVETWSGCLLKI